MDNLIFEHPLNEKSRNYLRFESLLLQLKETRLLDKNWHHQLLFKTLFDLVEISDRSDIKPDLLKDLEKQKKQLAYWSQLPGVDLSRVNQLQHSVSAYLTQLNRLPKLGVTIKEDKFLSSIRQRFILPGGTCCFDLPNLHWWLHQPIEYKLSDINRWLVEWDLIAGALNLLLSLMRENGEFVTRSAAAGFYQGVSEAADLIRIKVAANANHYPTVSGHKRRYAIRFMAATSADISQEDIPFAIANCAL